MITKARRIIDAGLLFSTTMEAKGRLESITFSTGYVEPGYDDPTSGLIAIGDWNPVTVQPISTAPCDSLPSQVVDDVPQRVGYLLEELGLKLENEDEWTICRQCERAFRTRENSHNWMFFGWDDGEGNFTCGECLYVDPTEYIAFLESHHNHCLTIPSIDLRNYGFVMLEQGFVHPGDNDPRLIVRALQDQGIDRYIIRMDSTGQFNSNFSVHLHESELPGFDVDAWHDAPKDVAFLSEKEYQALLAEFGHSDQSRNEAGGILNRGCSRLRLHSPDDPGDSSQDS